VSGKKKSRLENGKKGKIRPVRGVKRFQGDAGKNEGEEMKVIAGVMPVLRGRINKSDR